MRKSVWFSLVPAAALLFVNVAPIVAAARTAVHMEVATNFDPADDPFTANIDGCAGGTVATGDNSTIFTRTHGNFVGDKVFDCGGGTGFVVRLNAHFGSDGSVGTWTVTSAWGTLAGLRGSGKLVGIPQSEVSILDVYDGSIN